MNYWDSSEASEDVLAREAYEAMKPCNFSHSLCMFAGCAKGGEQSDGTITKENEILEVKSGREFISEKECVDSSTTNEGMESCVKFPSSTPVEIVQLYRKLDLHRRELEKQRIYVQGKLLKDIEQGNIFQTNDVEEELTDSLTEE